MGINEKGFTILELIFVIAIIIILAITVFSRYINITKEAQSNTTSYLASKLNSSANMNYYARTLNANSGIAIKNCRNVSSTLESPLPDGYTIQSKNIPANKLVNCTLKGPDKSTATFYARGIK